MADFDIDLVGAGVLGGPIDDKDMDRVWWFGPPQCHLLADTDNAVTKLTLTINVAKMDSVFFMDSVCCPFHFDEIMTGVVCCARVAT